MKKIIIISCIIALLSASLAFAENERNGNIIATIGFGAGSTTRVQTESNISFILDLNFISKTGFTICSTNIVGIHPAGGVSSQHIMFGAGYHFMRNRWNIGGAFLVSPLSMDVLFGGKINGSFFLTDDIGITGIFLHRRSGGITWEMSMFDVFVGASIRF